MVIEDAKSGRCDCDRDNEMNHGEIGYNSEDNPGTTRREICEQELGYGVTPK